MDAPQRSLADSKVGVSPPRTSGDRVKTEGTDLGRLLPDCMGAVIEATGEGFVAADAQGRLLAMNAEARRLLGDFKPGVDARLVLRPAVSGLDLVGDALAGRLTRIDLYLKCPRGEVPVALSMRRVPARGTVSGFVCLLRDLTEERLQEQQARRRERLAAIGELAAGVAHEIRNPLTGISNAAQVLQMRLSSEPEHARMINLILRETSRLNRIVGSLLSFARPGPPSMKQTDLAEVVARAMDLEAVHFERQGIRCRLEADEGVPRIYVDPDQIQQVVANLLRNAREAMPEGGSIEIRIFVVERHLYERRRMGRRSTDKVLLPSKGPLAQFVRIRVRDTGKGMPEAVARRIFDPFFTTKSGGTGLGLSVSQSIVEEHGGVISVHSIQGEGTTFEVDLPVERRRGERRRQA